MGIEEKESAARIALLFRAARKDAGYSQSDISKGLGISQGTLSKLENGVLTPSAPLWFEFCKMTKIPSDSLITGHIDHGICLADKTFDSIGLFKVSRKYLVDRGTTVRSVLPFLIQARKEMGLVRLNKVLGQIGVDPDYFCNLDHSLSISFLFDLWKVFEAKKMLNKTAPTSFALHSRDPEVHGHRLVHEVLEMPRTQGFKKLVQKAPVYERNFQYKILEEKNDKHILLSIQAEAHMDRYRNSELEAWGKFTCEYKKSYFQQFLKKDSSLKVSLREHECMFKPGGEKCLYEYHIA